MEFKKAPSAANQKPHAIPSAVPHSHSGEKREQQQHHWKEETLDNSSVTQTESDNEDEDNEVHSTIPPHGRKLSMSFGLTNQLPDRRPTNPILKSSPSTPSITREKKPKPPLVAATSVPSMTTSNFRMLNVSKGSLQAKDSLSRIRGQTKMSGGGPSRFSAYLKDEESLSMLSDFGTGVDPSYKTDFVLAPFYFEQTIIFGILVCLDSLLSLLAFLPIRFLLSIKRFLERKPLHPIQRWDLQRGLLLLAGIAVVSNIQLIPLAQFVRQESLLKLKILFTLLELMDRLLGSFGVNLLGSLFWCFSVPHSEVPRGRLWHVILSLIYVSLHSSFLLLHLIVFHVAIGGQHSALLSLLILVQFAEMKGGVLKKVEKVDLQNMCHDDVVERFQLLVFVFCLFFYNKHHMTMLSLEPGVLPSEEATFISIANLFYSLLVVYSSEILVDWIKHTSIANYMNYRPDVYLEFNSSFTASLKETPVNSVLTDRSFALAHSMGFFPIPLVVMMMKILSTVLPNDYLSSLAIILGGWILCILFKQISCACLNLLMRMYPERIDEIKEE